MAIPKINVKTEPKTNKSISGSGDGDLIGGATILFSTWLEKVETTSIKS